MKVQQNQIISKNNTTSFKSKYTFDVGASDPRGSLKILIQNNDGSDLFEYKGFVNDTTTGIKDNDDFVTKLAEKVDVKSVIEKDISEIETSLHGAPLSTDETAKLKSNLENLRLGQRLLQMRSAAERKMTGLALLLPGTIQEHTALFMANLKNKNKESLTDVDLDEVVKKIKSNGKIELSEKFKITSDFFPCKDLAGTGVGVAQKLANHPIYGKEFKEGFFATAVQTGGGFGAVDIKIIDGRVVHIETNECGHDLIYNPIIKQEERLGAIGASAKAIIKNFANGFGITKPEDIETLVKTGMAQIATKRHLTFNNTKDQKAIDILMKTGAYELLNKNSENSRLRIKDESLDKFEAASKRAVQAYADNLATHAITKIDSGARLYVVSGPLAMGLNETIQLNPALYEANDMRSLIFKFIDKRVGNDNTCSNLRKKHLFDIVCDRSLSVDNNTRGGAILLSGKAHAVKGRGEWIKVPLKALKAMK